MSIIVPYLRTYAEMTHCVNLERFKGENKWEDH